MKNSEIEKELEYFLIYDFIFAVIGFIYCLINNSLTLLIFSTIMFLVDCGHFLWVKEK